MAYAKTIWVDNTTPFITAAALNNMESGIAAADPTARPVIARPVLATGVVGQTRAGRQLAVSDFTALGLSTPIGLFNLGSTANLGSGGALTNKGTVTFATGITGAAGEAAQFTGSNAQALYIADGGSPDPFRIRSGTWACWFRTAKRGTNHVLLTKLGGAGYSWEVWIDTNNVLRAYASIDGSALNNTYGVTDVADDRWHFVVVTHDGSVLTMYVDGAREAVVPAVGPLFQGTGAMTIGGRGDSTGATISLAFNGRMDEAFVTSDVLSLDQVRSLYAVRVTHTLTTAPREADVTIDRFRRGRVLTQADFTGAPVSGTAPLRLYNVAGSGYATDAGSQNVAATGSGLAGVASGPDGLANGAVYFDGIGSYISATDAGLPSGTSSRTLGIWFKGSRLSGNQSLLCYGSSGENRFYMNNTTGGGQIGFYDGANAIAATPFGDLDGQWHHAAAVIDNAAVDGLKIKLYRDGVLVATSTTLASTTLAGAGAFRIGRASGAGTEYWAGSLARAFVTDYAMTPEQILALYAKGSQQLLSSPKNVGDHIEGIDATTAYIIGDTLEPQDRINIGVTV